jgi:hypothetical protein
VWFVGRRVLAAFLLAFGTLPGKAEVLLKVELNALDAIAGKCRMSFLVENGSSTAIEMLKLDLAIFGRDGAIERRLLTELGPVRAAKTVVRTFEVEGDCAAIGSVLVNDVTACAPASLGDCLDRMSLASRVASIRLFK